MFQAAKPVVRRIRCTEVALDGPGDPVGADVSGTGAAMSGAGAAAGG